ncbi:MAG: hypothetical protein CMN71_03365 [Sphingomonadaceae bacterium]|nr:hypothetical protein [Sphingomonadaceae bacterium]
MERLKTLPAILSVKSRIEYQRAEIKLTDRLYFSSTPCILLYTGLNGLILEGQEILVPCLTAKMSIFLDQ